MSHTMPHNGERDPRFIRYLLGELPEPERTKLEDHYLGDDETFERLVAAEEELIYTYVRGGLSPTQHSVFDRHIPSNAREGVESAISSINLNAKFRAARLPEIDAWLAK